MFDIAGTVIEDNGEVISAFRAALAKNGLYADEAGLKEFKGASKREVIATFVKRQWGNDPGNEERIAGIYQDFCRDLEGRYADGQVKPIAGARDTFTWLKERGIACATTTGFFRSVTDLILASTGWREMLSATICSDDVRSGRPAPYMIFRAMEESGIDDVREVLIVGDTPLDIKAGHRAGVRGVIGVLTGIHTEERLRLESPTHLLATVAHLPALMTSCYSIEALNGTASPVSV